MATAFDLLDAPTELSELWIILFGWELALAHLLTGIALCLTIIGIPLGLANLKLIPVSLTPLGREIVPTTENREFP